MSGSVRTDRRSGLVLAGALGLVFLALGILALLPASDPSLGAEVAVRGARSAAALRGSGLYRAQGCWYCHTMQVRDTGADRGYGKPGFVSSQAPVLGTERVGADLARAGGRLDEAQIAKAMSSGVHRSYAYLSDAQTRDLIAYLSSLR